MSRHEETQQNIQSAILKIERIETTLKSQRYKEETEGLKEAQLGYIIELKELVNSLEEHFPLALNQDLVLFIRVLTRKKMLSSIGISKIALIRMELKNFL